MSPQPADRAGTREGPGLAAPGCREVRKPGRPRSAETEARIIEAALDGIADQGVSGLSLEAVAAAAGVGKTTIYRRWANKEALVIDAFASLDVPLPPLDETRPVRDELVDLLDMMRLRAERTRATKILSCIMAEKARHPEVARRYHEQVTEPRQERIRAAIRRGIAEGVIRDDVDVETVLHLLAGPMLMRTMIGRHLEPPPPDFAATIVDSVLPGLAP